MKTFRLAAALAVAVASATTLSCNVNEYCLNCGVVDDGGTGDATDALTDGGPTDGNDANQCVPTGNEVCDGKDNDCDTNIDEGDLPEIGDDCANQMGECSGGVKICTNGAVSCTKLPSAEQCDGLDNDCNGSTDEGDPGGGAKCGTDQGECVAGRLHCDLTTHQITCGLNCGTVNAFDCPVGGTVAPFGTAETCDAKDNDCDSDFDEDVPTLDPCGGGTATADPNEGLCNQGVASCDGAGGTICSGATNPAFEDCDGFDNDCDGDTDEDTSFTTDPTNCGSCGNVCSLANAINGCRPTNGAPPGECFVIVCEDTFHDNNNNDADGCEFGPCTIQSSVETCNGVDDDCNPATNEQNLPPPPNFCLGLGACSGATATCQGSAGFVCNYNADVELDNDGNVLQQESKCDGIDNDCDGLIDEGEINLGDDCVDTTKQGVCQGSGTFECVPGQPDAAPVCNITSPGQPTPDAAETCDALDNDCDGKTDEGAADGDLLGQQWVVVPNTSPVIEIMKFEASRPDAKANAVGINQTFACSKPNVQPWTNVTHPQAEAACASVGARLCSETEWQKMCDPRQNFPIAGPPAATGFAYVEAENTFATAAGSAALGGSDTWQSQTPTGTNLQDFSGLAAMRALTDNGTSVSLANAPANAARLDYQFSLLASTQYVVWARVLAPNTAGDSIHFGLNPTAPGTANGGTATVPTLNVWLWVKSGTITTGAAGNYIASLYMAEDGLFVDAVAVTRQTGTTPPPFDERTWAYQSNPKIPQEQTCNGDEFDTTAGGTDQDAILATNALAQCHANGPGANDAFDMSGNVKEWTLERAPNQNPLRGGASNNEVDGLTCGLNFTLADDQFFFPNVGFRCCRLQ